ncbi:multiple epidermal growth factor-like domains protein 10 [Aplysia californica]|uniref:Multiple epidermal growth factor-like domains protein 10 n=1 Tax=Aplysia californica TaxID=6500 RepID=A0ABM0K6L0_APLCA|nr:multiple epidermal growth factor-like domains protein 10 [Aplysia californica]
MILLKRENRRFCVHYLRDLLVKVFCVLQLIWCMPKLCSSNPCMGTYVNGRSPCRVVYVYLDAIDTYKNQIVQCEVFGARIARIHIDKEAALASQMPNFIKMKNYFIGARQGKDGAYRWENSSLVGNFDADLWGWNPLLKETSRVASYCLALNMTKKWGRIPCGQPSPAICQLCVVPNPPLDSCFVHCVCPGGKVLCKTKGGRCEKGCAFARSGELCDQTPCPVDRFGEGCKYLCYCNNNTACDLVTGECPSDCLYGWTGKACNKTSCGLHTFGATCDRYCYCHNDQQCDPNNGDCFTGCHRGAYGSSCVQSSCPTGLYGHRCRRSCHCKIGTACSQTDGLCFMPGCVNRHWKGLSCNETKCYTGSFGLNCLMFCACKNREQCDYITGRCPQGCRPGWEGRSCNVTGCPLGRYGLRCGKRCDCGTSPCHRFSGICAEQSVKIKRANCQEPGMWGQECKTPCEDSKCSVCDRWEGNHCHECRDGFEKTPKNTCSPECIDDRVWGDTCARPCEDKNCAKCRKFDGSHCVVCEDGYVITPTKNCSKECKFPGTWGVNCNQRCKDKRCFRCYKYDGYKCDTCLVGSKLGPDGKKCVEDIYIATEGDIKIEGSHSITMELTVALILETAVCIALYYMCGCHKRGYVNKEKRRNNCSMDHQWVEGALQRRSVFVANAQEMERLEDEERQAKELQELKMLNMLDQSRSKDGGTGDEGGGENGNEEDNLLEAKSKGRVDDPI